MQKTKRRRYIIIFFLGILFFLCLYIFNTKDTFFSKQNELSEITFERARVLDIKEEILEESDKIPGLYRGTQELEILITSGIHKGEKHLIKNYLSDRFNVYAEKGTRIMVSIDTTVKDNNKVAVYNHYRMPVLLLGIGLFLLALCATGGKKGMRSLIGLAFTFLCLIFLFIPMLYRGYSPVFASVLVVVLTTTVSVFCINGFSLRSVAAILGTSCGVIIAGIISSSLGALAHISGLNTAEAEPLLVIASHTGMRVNELLFSGILIASLGAVMDVAISIAASVHEVKSVNPGILRKALFLSGMNVGRDMMGSMSNTLILAFVGTALNTLILLYSFQVNFNQLLNMDSIAIEIIQGMSGSIAIILTVPIVSLLASFLLTKNKK